MCVLESYWSTPLQQGTTVRSCGGELDHLVKVHAVSLLGVNGVNTLIHVNGTVVLRTIAGT